MLLVEFRVPECMNRANQKECRLNRPYPLSLESIPIEVARGRLRDLKVDYAFIETPFGRCLVGKNAGHICYMAFAPEGSEASVLADLSARWPEVSLCVSENSAGAAVTDVFSPSGSAERPTRLLVRGTPFQVQVWRALLGIPWGSVCTYAEVARRVGRPQATRAVGSAIGANPIAWLIPCHRVICSHGQLGGYRWGLTTKKACLDFEKRKLPDRSVDRTTY